MIPVHTQVAFSVSEELVPFECARCQFKGEAWVSGGGSGLKLNGVTVSDASLDARVGAKQAAKLAPCPRCGARDRVALAKVLALGAVLGLLAGMAVGLWGGEQLRRWDPKGHLVFPLGLAAFVVAVAVTAAFKLRSVRRRVRFVS